jgi:hypothetical protein
MQLIDWIIKVVSWFARRPTLRVRISRDDPEEHIGGLLFEVENVRNTPTSLEPTITVSFLTSRRKYGVAVFDVRDVNRELPPFQAKQFSASARQLPIIYSATWFRTYLFRPTHGFKARVRVRNAFLQPMPQIRFWIERTRFRLTGHVHDSGSFRLDEYETLKRSQGPH